MAHLLCIWPTDADQAWDDAAYLELAQRFELPVATLDQAVCDAVTAVNVQLFRI